ncbi:conserved hypothetical protein [Bradyrhizobium sp. ORS 375]|uniref:hypothetical protein n=1 Tax=Bradyrhizobium sp. (strain ORS 375) TaxID=566679 RepID=UPI0002407472|nr:hypothetical protein [Bradyrhizobium sp. ORS 375]CCD92553.1 conserved hypothetical protein [Bradyrhizobium sp. ORS 375]
MARGDQGRVRKLIAFDEDTFDKLKQLGRDQMLSLQDLADEAFMDLLEKHGVPADLKDALRRSAAEDGDAAAKPARKTETKTKIKPKTKPRQRSRTAA